MGRLVQSERTIDQYLRESVECIEAIRRTQRRRLDSLIRRIELTRDQAKLIFLIGNGGSGSTASHFASDLNKTAIVVGKRRLRALSLVDNMPLVSAWSNDKSYESIFSEQLENFASPGDLLIAISGSGNSPNILMAVKWAQRHGMYSFGLTGFDGGKLRAMVDECIVIPSDSMYRVEDMHLMINHLLMFVLTK